VCLALACAVLPAGDRWTATAATGTTPAARREHLAVVVNRANPIGALDRTELRSLFLGERTTWTNGRRVTLVLREPGQPERAAALRLIYGMSETDLTRHWLHRPYTGPATSGPRTLATAAGVRRFVVNVPGAIGLLRLADVDDTIKVVTINGAVPGHASYPLVIGEP
jgi:ABC-type phosphate transport system substrate-binding protein